MCAADPAAIGGALRLWRVAYTRPSSDFYIWSPIVRTLATTRFCAASKRLTVWLLLVWLSLVATTTPLLAQTAVSEAPPELAAWRGWVLGRQPDLNCPLEQSQRSCFWPGRMTLAVNAGAIQLDWAIENYRTTALYPLPGEQGGVWPQQVRINGAVAAVVARDGQPHLNLQPGLNRNARAISYGWAKLNAKSWRPTPWT
jgi:hypothetical protein